LTFSFFGRAQKKKRTILLKTNTMCRQEWKTDYRKVKLDVTRMSSSTFNSEPSTFRFPFCGSEATMLLKTQSWLSSRGSESHDVHENEPLISWKATMLLQGKDLI